MFKVGTKIKIISGGSGAYGVNQKTGIVTEDISNSGLLKSENGFNVRVTDKEVWRVSFNGKYEVVSIKSILKSGDMVVYRDGEERFILVEVGGMYDEEGFKVNRLCNYNDDLTGIEHKDLDIMEIRRDGALIWKREEETPEQKELKEIEEKQRELSKEQEKLAQRIKELTNK